MRKLRILVDIDGTLCDTLGPWLDRIHEKTGVRAFKQDIVKWNIHECTPLDNLTPYTIFDILHEPGFYRKLPPLPYSQKALKALKDDGHEIYLVTARQSDTGLSETLGWATEHFSFIDIKQVIFCYDKHLIKGDILIDDKAETLVQYKNHHPDSKVMGISYPYNDSLLQDPWTDAAMFAEYPFKGINGKYPWEGIFEHIRKLSND